MSDMTAIDSIGYVAPQESGDVPRVVCVILNTNRREDTLSCLASLQESTYANLETIVLDNASTDGSLEAIASTFTMVQTLSLSENLGYAGNNNVGIAAALEAGADWVFVLNEDTVLAPDCLSTLVSIGESQSAIGILGPMVYHYDEPQVIQTAGGILGPCWESVHLGANEPDRGQFGAPHDVEWISGCAIMVRRQVIEQVGALDPRFFYYWEETEWCVRAARAGWRMVHVPQARLWHKGVQRHYTPRPPVTYYATRNRLLLYATHRAPVAAWVKACVQVARTVVSWSVRPKWRSMRDHRNAMLLGVVDALRGRWGRMPE